MLRQLKRGLVAVVVMAMMTVSGECTVWADDTGSTGITGEANAAVLSGYKLGIGDVVAISVWHNDDLSRIVQVLPDGNISFPLIGDLQVKDLTVAELVALLKEKIEPYVLSPDISVEVQKVNSLMIYVIGKVHRPDRFLLSGNVNVLQALAMAGGLTPFADRDEIKVIRETNGSSQVFPFDYDAVIQENSLAQNIQLQRGDIIVVP